MKNLSWPKIFLTSKSPRRRQLLKACDIPFEVIEIDVDETHPLGVAKQSIAEFLAIKKANAGLKIIDEGIIVAADTVVILNNEILEKPTDFASAREMLSSLSGKSHEVITGVCMQSKSQSISFSCSSIVHLEPMTNEEIDYYVQKCRPLDKAGAYGIQDWIGWAKISRIEGSYANIMGLPVHEVYHRLKMFEPEA